MIVRFTALLLFFISIFLFKQYFFKNYLLFASENGSEFIFVEIPKKGFKNLNDLKNFALNSLPGGGEVIEVKIGGQSAWAMTRYLAFEQSVSDMTLFWESPNGFLPFYSKPMIRETLLIEQKDDWVLISRFNYKTKKYEKAIAFYYILTKDRSN